MSTLKDRMKKIGFVSAHQLGLDRTTLLEKAAKDGAIPAPVKVGERTFYDEKACREFLASRSYDGDELPAGFVVVKDYSLQRGYSATYGAWACNSGYIKSAKHMALADRGNRPMWVAKESELAAWFDRERVAHGGAVDIMRRHAERQATNGQASILVVDEQAQPDVVARLEALEARFAALAERFEAVLGTSPPPAPPATQKMADIVITAPDLGRIR